MALHKPLFIASLLYASGIAGGLFAPLPLLALAAGGLLAALILSCVKFSLKLRLALGFFVCFMVGGAYGLWQHHANQSHLQDSWENRSFRAAGVMLSPPQTDGDQTVFTVRSGGENLLLRIKLLEEQELQQVAVWHRGDKISFDGVLQKPSVAGNFQTFDYRNYLTNRRIHWIVAVNGTNAVRVEPGKRWRLITAAALVDRWRGSLVGRLHRHFHGDAQGLLESLLLGFRNNLSAEVYQRFSNLGLSHLLAISGLHVGIVLGGIMGLFKLLRVTRETRVKATMAIVPVYVLLTGASPSVFRAGLMALLALFALRRGMLKDSLYLVGLAGALMLSWNPYYLADIGFQLSFLITIGLILGVPTVIELLPIKAAAVRNSLAVVIVAQMVSFPLTIYYFNIFSLLSPLANLLLVPLYGFIVLPLGYAALLLDFIHPSLAGYPAVLLQSVIDFSFALMNAGNGIAGIRLIWGTPPVWWIILYYLLLGFSVWFLLRWKRAGALPWQAAAYLSIHRGGAFFAGALLILLLWRGYDPVFFQKSHGQVDFLNVGQGDACLIQTSSGKHILIDGGGTLGFRKKGESWRDKRDPYEVGKDLLVPLLKKRGVHAIDLLVVSHEDMDHIGGLRAVVEQIPVKAVWFNGTLKDSPVVRSLFQAMLSKRIPLFPVYDGMRLAVDRSTQLRVLYPEKGGQRVDLNNQQNLVCLVVEMRMYESSFLFAGDIPSSVEEEILSHHPQLEAGGEGSVGDISSGKQGIDVLKVAHHGSRTSTEGAWLDFFHPHMAVISVGKHNPYGHPTNDVLQRLADRSIETLRTDIQGEIQYRVTAKQLEFRYLHQNPPTD